MSEGILVLAGATGSGKTELAIELAVTFDAEIVGADSRQVYRGMDVGTAMPSSAQLAAVRHHAVGIADPYERYSAGRYVEDAMAAIGDIRSRGKRVVVAGGTGFYIRALLGRVALAPEYDESLRDRLAREARVHPSEFLHAWLALRDPSRAAALAPGDTYRILRALEVARHPESSERSERSRGTKRTLASEGVNVTVVFLDVPLDELDRRIAHRADRMLAAGFVEEAERVGSEAVAANAVGYPQAFAYLRGWSTEAELRALLVRATQRYARRQRAWFRGEPGTLWLEAGAVEAAAREKAGWFPKST